MRALNRLDPNANATDMARLQGANNVLERVIDPKFQKAVIDSVKDKKEDK